MSWSVHATINGKSARSELEALRETALSQNSEGVGQFNAAKDAALAILASSAIGWAENKRFHVTLSGHANPKHEPREGWANDMINVSVSQA